MKLIAKVTKAEAQIVDAQGKVVMDYRVENSQFEMDLAALIASGAELVREMMKQELLIKALKPKFAQDEVTGQWRPVQD